MALKTGSTIIGVLNKSLAPSASGEARRLSIFLGWVQIPPVSIAGITQLVEYQFSKLDVESSSLSTRTMPNRLTFGKAAD